MSHLPLALPLDVLACEPFESRPCALHARSPCFPLAGIMASELSNASSFAHLSEAPMCTVNMDIPTVLNFPQSETTHY